MDQLGPIQILEKPKAFLEKDVVETVDLCNILQVEYLLFVQASGDFR
ncbi:MAG: hypothetical protein HC920_12825 [Oscillatoriales cyanobacterium SM2_3_0]|nr:hypothetical protein [Oscillatoriales cyanobacterium SM2_3_0]